MRFEEFLKFYAPRVFIDSKTFTYFDKPQDIRRQVNYWLKKGFLIKLKKGIYIFSEEFRKQKVSGFLISNYLISPSYISLETALGYYGLIPEKITTFTAITTRKTTRIKNPLGVFLYTNIKKELFFGFTKKKEDDYDFFIAEPEKAILDYFYFKKQISGSDEEFEELRFQNIELLEPKKLLTYAERYNQRVLKIAKAFIEWCGSNLKSYHKL